MFNLFKKKKKDNDLTRSERREAVSQTEVYIDEKKIRTIPENFLPKGRGKTNRFQIIIIVVIILIVVVGIFTGLLLFSESFNKMLFGGEVEVIKGSSEESEVQPGELGKIEEVIEKVEQPEFFRQEVINEQSEVAGVIVFEKRKEFEYLDLRVDAFLPESELIFDENNNKFRIIGGVYSFEPGGVRLADKDFLLELFYNASYLKGSLASDLRVLNWEEEPKISFLPSEVKALENKVGTRVDVLPKGKIALAVLVAEESEFLKDKEVEPVGSIPATLDSDEDGLTDLEEGVYGLDAGLADTNSDGVTDDKEVLAWYAVRVNEEPDFHLEAYRSEAQGYSIYYPVGWSLEPGKDEVVAFVSVSGELVRIIIQANPQKLNPRDWYLGQASGVKASQIRTGVVNGLEAAWSLDQFTAYVARGEDIYLINYNVGLREQAGFKTTFEGIVRSFHFPEMLISSYKHENEKYSFSLELPLTWEEYDVYNYKKVWGEGLEADSLMFRLPTQYPEDCNSYERCATFVINVFDFITWNDVRLLDKAPLLINVNNDYVFAYYKNEVYGNDLTDRMSEIDDIIETFAFE